MDRTTGKMAKGPGVSTTPRGVVSLLALACAAIASTAHAVDWSKTTARLEAIRASRDMAPFSVRVHDASGALVFQKSFGGYDDSQAVPVASAAKWVTGVVVMSVVEEGRLSLESTTGEVLGWTGSLGTIRLDELLSLRSGLEIAQGEDLTCFGDPRVSLQRCVDDIRTLGALASAPGEQFRYGGLDHQVAAAMAERATGKSWRTLFEERVARPLGLKNTFYYSQARGQPPRPSDNPVVAGALVSTTADYTAFLRALFLRGRTDAQPASARLLSPEGFAALEVDYFARATKKPSLPQRMGFFGGFHYGAGHWIECRAEGAVKCAPDSPRSSLGSGGWYPWLDRKTGYYALLATEQDSSNPVRTYLLAKALFDIKQEVARAAESAL